MERWLGTTAMLMMAGIFTAVAYVGWTGPRQFREVAADRQPRQDARLLIMALLAPGTVVVVSLVLAAVIHWNSPAWIWIIGVTGVPSLLTAAGVVLYGRPGWLVPAPYRPWTGLLDRPNRAAG